MREFSRDLKPSLLGGYDRESVLKTMESLMEAVRDGQSRLEESQRINKNLMEQNSQLHRQYTALVESVQGTNKNMETLLRDNKYLTGQVERYKAKRAEVAALRASIEDEANGIIEDAQAQAWDIERERADSLRATQLQIESMLEDARKEQERIAQSAEKQRIEETKQLEKSLSEMLSAAEYVDAIVQRVREVLPSRETEEVLEARSDVVAIGLAYADAAAAESADELAEEPETELEKEPDEALEDVVREG